MAIWLRIKVDAVGYSGEHVAIGDAVVLGHAHADTVASGVYHGFEVTGGVNPIVDSASGGVGCAREHGQVVTEAIRVANVGSSLAFLRSVMPSITLVGTNLGGVHQGFVDGQFRYPIGLTGLVDQLDYLLPYLKTVISALPSALATATQEASTRSTATVSGSLEVTVYSVLLGPMIEPPRSPTSRILPL